MKKIYMVLSLMLIIVAAGQAQASLSPNYQFNGNGDWSLSAVGSSNTPVGNLQAVVPTGSTVEKAFLYSSLYSFSSAPSTPSVTFGGTTYSGAQFTPLTVVSSSVVYLRAFRTDVTSQVTAAIGGGGGTYNFSVSENPNTTIDGEVLAIVYSNPAAAYRTIAFLDGGSAQSGDSFTFNFTKPVDPTASGFRAQMSLGIGFSYQGTDQYSLVNVNGQRLTTSAGGQDDGVATSGGLITVGGIGDNFSTNPANPNALPNGDPRYDDEAYNLASFLTKGDSSFSVFTQNPSLDDNIFFAGVNVTAEGTVVPVPPSLLLFGSGLLGLAGWRRFRKG